MVFNELHGNSIDIPLNLECFMDDKDVSGKINRAEFEELAQPLLDRIQKTLEAGLVASGLKKEDLYSVEIVGGATRMPCFKSACQVHYKKYSRQMRVIIKFLGYIWFGAIYNFEH